MLSGMLLLKKMSIIPKIIHYCWFGHNPLPKSAIKCISSWRKFFPDYEIKEWNEDNFDVNIIPYTAEAYEAKKYAFVSDYARIWILYKFGGVYFDTDVEVVKPMDDLLTAHGYMGIERCFGAIIHINPGLGCACEIGNHLCEEILAVYSKKHFKKPNGSYDFNGIVPITTSVFKRHGLISLNEKQLICNMIVYPSEYFNPYDYTIDKLEITQNTRSIHWYGGSWTPFIKKVRLKIGIYIRKFIKKNIK